MRESQRWLMHRVMYVGFLATLMLLVWAVSEPLAKIDKLMKGYEPIIEHLKD